MQCHTVDRQSNFQVVLRLVLEVGSSKLLHLTASSLSMIWYPFLSKRFSLLSHIPQYSSLYPQRAASGFLGLLPYFPGQIFTAGLLVCSHPIFFSLLRRSLVVILSIAFFPLWEPSRWEARDVMDRREAGTVSSICSLQSMTRCSFFLSFVFMCFSYYEYSIQVIGERLEFRRSEQSGLLVRYTSVQLSTPTPQHFRFPIEQGSKNGDGIKVVRCRCRCR
jgi:hypothetical protein